MTDQEQTEEAQLAGYTAYAASLDDEDEAIAASRRRVRRARDVPDGDEHRSSGTWPHPEGPRFGG